MGSEGTDSVLEAVCLLSVPKDKELPCFQIYTEHHFTFSTVTVTDFKSGYVFIPYSIITFI